VLPRISVVIACYNQPRELELTLTSFLQQQLSFSAYELIVVDDHSTDDSARCVVAGFRRRYPEAAVLYVRQYRTDGGIYGSSAKVKNIGLRLAQGEYVFFNNAEIVQAGESLAHILKAMDAASGPLCLRGRVMDLPFDQLAGRTQAQLEALHDGAKPGAERVASADHAGLAVIPRKLLLTVGGNDERFDYWGKEDLDLAARLKRAGATYVYDEQLKSCHISHPPNHVKQFDYLRMCALLEENNSQAMIEANRGRPWGGLNQPPSEILKGTIIVEAGADTAEFARRLEALVYSSRAGEYEVLAVCLDNDRAAVESLIHDRYRPLPLVSLAPGDPAEHAARVLRHVRTRKISFLPVGASFSPPAWESLLESELPLRSWTTELTASDGRQNSTPTSDSIGWLAMTEALRRLGDIGPPSSWMLPHLLARVEQSKQVSTSPIVQPV
jgi:glycosyltransferase involved in cell wall biosynthesis